MNTDRSRAIAMWTGLSVFFGNILGLKVLEVISGKDWLQVLSAVLFSALAGAAVYARERLTGLREDGGSNG